MELARLKTDVLIMGGGAAGCRAAIAAHDCGAQVILAAKGRFTRSGSTFYPLTMGVGYTTAIPGGDPAGIEAHWQEIVDAGQGMVSPTLARILAEEAPERLEDLIERYAVAFRVKDGEVLYIKPDFGSGQVRAGGATEDAIRVSFSREIGQREIRVLEKTSIVRLLGDSSGCTGAVGLTPRGDLITISAKTTVLATGGGSTAFLYHMNTPDLTFDGHSMALELGAELVNMEFYQMILGLTGPLRRMLIPESYLALEPRLTNGLGDEFLPRYLPRGVTQAECLRKRAGTGPFRSDAAAKYFDIAIFDEVRAGRGTVSGGVRADFTGVDLALIETGKLDWYKWATARGVDVCARPVDISPHVHAFNGGVQIDSHAETTVPNLFACGEAAGGPHGANRIGGNQFAGTQVFGQRAGKFAAARSAELSSPGPSAMIDEQVAVVYERLSALQRCESGRRPQEVRYKIQAAMWNEMGVHKNADSLNRCLEKLSAVEEDLSGLCLSGRPALFLALSLPHLLTVARIIARAALMREESRGPHYRTDFPSRDDRRFGKPIAVRIKDGKLEYRFRNLE